jgi:hypothetical protein
MSVGERVEYALNKTEGYIVDAVRLLAREVDELKKAAVRGGTLPISGLLAQDTTPEEIRVIGRNTIAGHRLYSIRCRHAHGFFVYWTGTYPKPEWNTLDTQDDQKLLWETSIFSQAVNMAQFLATHLHVTYIPSGD